MAEDRILYTPAELREKLANQPQLDIRVLDKLDVSRFSAMKHVTAKDAFLLAIDLWGLSRAFELVEANHLVLASWMCLTEDYGWGRVDEEMRDIQMTFLLNALKIIATSKTNDSLKRQEIIHEFLDKLSVSKEAHMKIIDLLVLKKQVDLPWTIWVHV